MKGPAILIALFLTLLSLAAVCFIPLLRTRDEIVLTSAVWPRGTVARIVLVYREPAMGMVTEWGTIDSPVGPGSAPHPDDLWKRRVEWGWSSLASPESPRARSNPPPPGSGLYSPMSFSHDWSLGVGWPMICLIAEGDHRRHTDPKGALELARRILIAGEGAPEPSDITHRYSRSFDALPTRIDALGLAVNLVAHGLVWFSLVALGCFVIRSRGR